MKEPLVSIIVPNYNHEPYLDKRLESIFNQTYNNFEVILLDDCSDDNSRSILEKFSSKPKVTHYLVNEENSGNTFMQWKNGLTICRGEIVWIAESDDYCDSNFLEVLVYQMLCEQNVSIVYCQSKRINNQGNIKGDWSRQTDAFNTDLFESNFMMEGNTFIKNFLIFKNVIPNVSAVLFRKNCIKDYNIFNEISKLKYNGDWLFYVYLLLNNDIVFVHDKLNYHRFHDKSVIAKAVNSEGREELVKIEIKTRRLMNTALFMYDRSKFGNLIKLNNWLITRLRLKAFTTDLKRMFKK